MNYSKKDIIIGFVIIALIILGAFLFKRYKASKLLTPSPSPVPVSFKNEIEDSFKYQIPEDTTSIGLRDVSGGNGRGLATDKEILADIDNPSSGKFYQGWLENSDGRLVSLGKLQSAKGGWMLEYDGSKYEGYRKVVVSLESKFDNTVETKILEGSFN
jgi:hypothetical protein